MPYTYILQSLKTRITYTGSTVNLERRVEEHNAGREVSTKKYAPWKLVYYEEFPNINDARRREKYFKSAAGRKCIKKLNIIRE
jgi:putative endonuclease